MSCVRLPKTNNGLAVAHDLIDTAKLTAGVQAQAMLAAGMQAMLAETAVAQARVLPGEAVARLESERFMIQAAISSFVTGAHRDALAFEAVTVSAVQAAYAVQAAAYMAQVWALHERMLAGYHAQLKIAANQAATLRAAAAPVLPLLRVALRRCVARTSTAPPDEDTDSDSLAPLACVSPRPASSRFILLSTAVRPTLAPVVRSAALP